MNIEVRIKPNSKENRISIIKNLLGTDIYQISVKFPPIEGKANEEMIKILSDYLKIPKSKVRIISGFKSRSKIIKVEI